MNEPDYWLHLEFRVCREFAGMRENHLRFRWCDGFIPGEYDLAGPRPCIKGCAWICDGRKQEEWEFTLFLDHSAGSRAEIDWTSLLPPPNVTKWMTVDLIRKRIKIEPSAAVADAV